MIFRDSFTCWLTSRPIALIVAAYTPLEVFRCCPPMRGVCCQVVHAVMMFWASTRPDSWNRAQHMGRPANRVMCISASQTAGAISLDGRWQHQAIETGRAGRTHKRESLFQKVIPFCGYLAARSRVIFGGEIISTKLRMNKDANDRKVLVLSRPGFWGRIFHPTNEDATHIPSSACTGVGQRQDEVHSAHWLEVPRYYADSKPLSPHYI